MPMPDGRPCRKCRKIAYSQPRWVKSPLLGHMRGIGPPAALEKKYGHLYWVDWPYSICEFQIIRDPEVITLLELAYPEE